MGTVSGKGTKCKHTTYRIKSKFLSSKSWIENETGETVFYDGGGNLLDAQRNVLLKDSLVSFSLLERQLISNKRMVTICNNKEKRSTSS